MSLGFESFPIIARRDCTGCHTASYRHSTSGISKGNVLGYYCNLGSLRYGNDYCIPGCAMSCTPQSLHSKKSEMRRRSGRLYSQMLRPFWRALAGYIAIGLLIAAAVPLVRFFSTARTNGRAVSLRDCKRLQLKRKKEFFPYSVLQTQYSFPYLREPRLRQ